MGSKNIITVFVVYLLPKIVIINKIISAQKDSCLSRQQLELAYIDYEQKLSKVAQDNSLSNETIQVPQTAEQLTVDKEAIKRVPTVNGQPVQIKMTFYIDDINSISDVDMDFRLDFYYLQQWSVYEEDCTTYKNSLIGRNVSLENVTELNKFVIGNEYFALFWLPDIMISNAKSFKQQSDIIDTRLLMIYFWDEKQETCQMEFMARFESIVSCPMNFEDAPIDEQNCSVQLRSFAFDMQKVNLLWGGTVEKNPDIKLLEHDLHIKQSETVITLFNESYSTLVIKMLFDRKLANKMVGVYTPSILIVLITFCTFWLGLNSTSERVTIGITALLALVTQFNDVRQSLPPTSYITEIDKWMIMCMVFVSAQMIQCTLVDHVYHHQQHNQQLKERAMNVLKKFRRNSEVKQKQRLLVPDLRTHKYNYPEKVDPYTKFFEKTNQSITNTSVKKASVKVKEPSTNGISWFIKLLWSLTSVPTSPDKPEYLPMKIDAYSRIIFPLFFATICIVYWPIMLLKNRGHQTLRLYGDPGGIS